MNQLGFASVNTYLLGEHESRNKSDPPPPGPTISDFYTQSSDRHKSGMWAFANDHLRGTFEPDSDVPPLQTKQDVADYLTDSESDDEDEYEDTRPTISRVKSILRPSQIANEANEEESKPSELKKGTIIT